MTKTRATKQRPSSARSHAAAPGPTRGAGHRVDLIGTLSRGARPWIALGLIALTVLVYAQVAGFGFVSFDDDLYVTANTHILNGVTPASLAWAFTTRYGGNWMPLTWISHMIDVQLFGLEPGPMHLVNLSLHIFSTIMLFAFFARTTGSTWRSAFVAAIFAVHPLHVESVAWIAQRKDVLSTALLMCAIWAYVRYAATGRRRDIVIVAAFMAAGLMTKPMLVTLPVLLLLLDIWPLGRLTSSHAGRIGPVISLPKLLLEKLPLFAMAAALGIATIVLQRKSGAMHEAAAFALTSRLANVAQSLAAYLGQTIWPASLTVHYPYPRSFNPLVVTAAAALIAGLSAIAWFARQRRPYITTGWAWFLVAVAPAIGVIQVGFQARGDRFMYVALIGLTAAVTWGLGEMFVRRRSGPFVLGAAAALAISGCAVQAHRQAAVWRDGFTLWQHTVSVTHDNRIADTAYGIELLSAGRNAEAETWLTRALALDESDSLAQMELGASLSAQGKLDDGIAHLERARAIDPGRREIYALLGQAYIDSDRFAQGRALYIQAADLLPDNPVILSRVAWLLATSAQAAPSDASKAVPLAERAVGLTHGQDLGALDAQAAAYAAVGRFDDAVRVITSAVGVARNQRQSAALPDLEQRGRLYQAHQRLRISTSAR